MSHMFLQKSSFHNFLKTIDYDLAQEQCAKGCVHCGGRLHQSNYPRSPFGVPKEHRQYYDERYSYCCSRCRKRTTSQSVRYFGRRWFPALLMVLISALMRSTIDKCRKQLHRIFGIRISKRTCKRWKHWWRHTFTKTGFWKSIIGLIPLEHLGEPFPRRLFLLFEKASSGCGLPRGRPQPEEVDTPFARQLVRVLGFLAPLTAGRLRAV